MPDPAMRIFAPIAAAALVLTSCGRGAPAPEGNDAAAPPPVPAPPRANLIPVPFHGLYAATAAGCARADETRLTVTAGELRFHESIGAVRAVAVEAPGRVRVTSDFEGEGESWRATHRLSLSNGGATLAVGGSGTHFVRVRCAASPQPEGAARWDLESSGEETALALFTRSGGAAIRLFCRSGRNQLLVNIPSFRPIGSEERLSFGSGGEVVALVADASGDRRHGGVSGTGAMPHNLASLVEGRVSASYGAQTSGPHPAPPAELARAFAAACGGRTDAARLGGNPPTGPGGACLMQGSERLRVGPLRAIGTEPFWGARIEGRCVTYSHPEDQDGTRIWTRYTAGPGGGTWSGTLGGRRFELRIGPQPGCSDGMSDKRYPFAAALVVQGEQRRGCAEPG